MSASDKVREALARVVQCPTVGPWDATDAINAAHWPGGAAAIATLRNCTPALLAALDAAEEGLHRLHDAVARPGQHAGDTAALVVCALDAIADLHAAVGEYRAAADPDALARLRHRCARQHRELRRLNVKIRDVAAFMSGRWYDYGQRRAARDWQRVRQAVGATDMGVSDAEVVQRVERLARNEGARARRR